MKQLNKIQFIGLLLGILLTFQYCKSYEKQVGTVERAISTEKYVKVVMNNEENYYFCKLIRKDTCLYGITRINSATAKKLDSLIELCSVDGKIAKIRLFEDRIQAVYLSKK